ncbi:tRNA (adenine-N1)-methyltransferase [Candidatus Woesearchaeota archaeon]|nr:tRNA (adenine-N1)-methyltransferase [Candidatus Woesearchaeota archaeon]MBW3021378.1 tRNA (adenine-N1)-methyltransferase [Candidatus Woesearchaeota archaeon]
MQDKILITPDNKTFYVKDTSKDFHTHLGIVSSEELKKEQGSVTTNTGKQLSIFTPTPADIRLKRGAAIVLPKDIGYIIATTGLNKNSKVVDAGTGSGALAIALANVAKKVFTYEIDERHYKIAKHNIEEYNIKNITIKNKDFKDAAEKDADVITLDMPQPWDYNEAVAKILRPAGFLVTYLPTITQVQEMVKKTNLRHIKTVELIEREWHIEGRKVRPMSRMIGHTAFLSFFRKI